MPLLLPDSRFPEQRWFDCGLTCARCVLEYYEKDVAIADRLHPDALNGTHPSDMIDVFLLAGLNVASGSWSIETVKQLRGPFVAFVNAVDGVDHYVVVAGISRGRVHMFDPDDGNVKWKLDDFVSRWHSIDHRGQLYRRGGILVTNGN